MVESAPKRTKASGPYMAPALRKCDFSPPPWCRQADDVRSLVKHCHNPISGGMHVQNPRI